MAKKQTKLEKLIKFALRAKRFRYGDVNRKFKQQPNSLNTYTTYLNMLRRLGYVKQTDRGQYVVNKNLKGATSREILVGAALVFSRDKLSKAIDELKLQSAENRVLYRKDAEKEAEIVELRRNWLSTKDKAEALQKDNANYLMALGAMTIVAAAAMISLIVAVA